MLEQDLLEKMKTGNQGAFDSIFNTHYEPLVRVAHSLVSDLAVAEDVVQEVFIKFWERRETVNIEKTIYGYLKQAVIFRSIDYLRKTKRLNEHILIHQQSTLQLNLHTPEKELLSKENLKAIYEKIEALPEKSKLIFKLSRFEELSYSEIAQQLNVSVKTVEYHISRALEILRESVFGVFVIAYLEV